MFRHEAFFYRSAREFVDDSVAFVLDALADGAAILVAADTDALASLQSQLGTDADRVEFVALHQAGRNPGRILALWDDFVDRHRDRPVRGIGEPVWAARRSDELIECQHFEHLLNHAYGDTGTDLWLRCAYDVASLAEPVLRSAAQAHPFLRTSSGTRANGEYRPGSRRPLSPGDLSPPPASPTPVPITVETLAELRATLYHQAGEVGLSKPRADDFVLVMGELVANTIQHAGGAGSFVCWVDHRRLVGEVRDGGCVDDALVGRRRPSASSLTGRGLWLTHQLADLAQLRSDGSGTTVRVSFDLAG